MGSTPLRQLLKSLCTNSDWNYAVFWKLRHHNPKFLSWEDGYFDQTKRTTGTENLSDMLYFDGSSYTTLCDESNLLYECANQYDIGRLVADMSCLQYAFGEGLVGTAACTGNDYWMSPHYIPATYQSKISEFPDEWISQFWAGIKTVLLVPVLPHGILQLGSVKVVDEDTTISDRIKERYYSYRIVSDSSSFSASKNNGPSDESLNWLESFMEELDDPSTVICNPLDELLSEESEYSTNTTSCDMLAFGPPLPLPNVLVDAGSNKDSVSFLGLPVEFIHTNQPSAVTPLEVPQNNQFSAFGLSEDLSSFSKYNNFGLTDKFYPRIGQFHDIRNITAGTCKNEEGGEVEMGFGKIGRLFSLATLGPTLNTQIHGYMEDGYLSIGDLPSNSCFTSNQDFHLIDSQDFHLIDSQDFNDSMEQSTVDLGVGGFQVRSGAEGLLEAVICNMYGCVDDCSPTSSEDLKPTITTVDCEFVASAEVPTKSEAAVECDHSFPQCNTGKSLSNMGGTFSTKTSTASLKSVLTTLSDKVKQDGCSTEQAKDEKKLNGRKRKGKTGDYQKPRPRDRQLIQDRVKELRELVPNSSKCSIDALLNQTIKHMGFLRGVTDQAERLRNCLPPKQENTSKIWRTLGIEDDHQREKSRSFDFGTEFQVYPIVVEDLAECSGHLLIEMLCDEQGQFFEIAQVIVRLDLTILKGSIETRADNNWAHFIVEASPGFQKTDIFWPLMQILQRQGNPICSTGV